MLSLTNLNLTYPDGNDTVTALDNVTLTPEPGTLVGITGPSGSGKSSLLTVAATLTQPDSGSVMIDGIEASRLKPAEAARLRREKIGIVFQQSNLLPSLTAHEQIRAVIELAGTRAQKRAARARAGELLEAVGLSAQANLRPAQLSGGQRQRVNIARALVANPSVLLVDEPTSALDSRSGATIIDLLIRMTKQLDVTTLLVTHDLQHAHRFDEMVTLVDGRITDHTKETSRITVGQTQVA
ncbi:ABC transporter ATP-binding protein [Pseudoglutamicibacter cumminsii]|uniref:ABC transporter ATP-binding protein n=1 Tax=Pseudoglutamicibacter cumminsii TaxID=156979 RepID=UPI002554C565|nr:ABC transporter ATP-binding protein [Pseudoglutamicibacter cumminsii]MDZ3745896.1 ABC transporter ATP-binding protein [Pseudoglutamicibacter cumminsii]